MADKSVEDKNVADKSVAALKTDVTVEILHIYLMLQQLTPPSEADSDPSEADSDKLSSKMLALFSENLDTSLANFLLSRDHIHFCDESLKSDIMWQTQSHLLSHLQNGKTHSLYATYIDRAIRSQLWTWNRAKKRGREKETISRSGDIPPKMQQPEPYFEILKSLNADNISIFCFEKYLEQNTITEIVESLNEILDENSKFKTLSPEDKKQEIGTRINQLKESITSYFLEPFENTTNHYKIMEYYLEGKTQEEMKTVMKVSIGLVSSTFRQACNKLSKQLGSSREFVEKFVKNCSRRARKTDEELRQKKEQKQLKQEQRISQNDKTLPWENWTESLKKLFDEDSKEYDMIEKTCSGKMDETTKTLLRKIENFTEAQPQQTIEILESDQTVKTILSIHKRYAEIMDKHWNKNDPRRKHSKNNC